MGLSVRACAVLVSASLGCGARSDLLDTIEVRVVDASIATDATDRAGDASRRDSSSPRDAFVQVPDATMADAKRDAGIDSPTDAPLPECGATGSGGTLTTLFQSSAPILDFDVDQDGIVFVLSDGTVGTCPLSGCCGDPTLLATPGAFAPVGSDSGFGVRFGKDVIFVYASVPVPVDGHAPPPRSDTLYTQPRTGGGATPLEVQGVPYPCGVSLAGALGNEVYVFHACEEGLNESVEVVLPGADGGVAAASGDGGASFVSLPLPQLSSHAVTGTTLFLVARPATS